MKQVWGGDVFYYYIIFMFGGAMFFFFNVCVCLNKIHIFSCFLCLKVFFRGKVFWLIG